jgi:hypothetical protein
VPVRVAKKPTRDVTANCAPQQWPCHSAAEQRDELAPPHRCIHSIDLVGAAITLFSARFETTKTGPGVPF